MQGAAKMKTVVVAAVVALFGMGSPVSAEAAGYATLLMQSQPAGASLHFNNALYTSKLGDADFPLTLMPGQTVTVRVTKSGYGSYSQQFNLPAGEVRRLQITLQPGSGSPVVQQTVIKRGKRGKGRSKRLAQGLIDIVANINGATIEIDGKSRGRSPMTRVSLDVGRTYGVTISAPGYKAWERTLRVKAGHNPTLVASLTALPKGAAAAASPSRSSAAVKVARKVMGQAGRGKPLFAKRCATCHGKSSRKLNPRARTAAQWSRFLASGRHAYRASLVGKVSVAELADVKAYLMSDAADVARGVAAGVR